MLTLFIWFFPQNWFIYIFALAIWVPFFFCAYQMNLKGKSMKENELNKVRKIIKYALIKIGFQVNRVGFKYLCYAIELVIQDPSLIHRLCKGVYAKVAEEYNVKYLCIERDIRHSIEATYIDRSFLEVNQMFKTNIFTIDSKPKTGELIQLIVEYYNLELYKQEGVKF